MSAYATLHTHIAYATHGTPTEMSLRSLIGLTGGSLCVGELGTLDPRPVLSDTLYSSFSCGKAICALLLHVLAHKGFLDLDESVSAIWPEFRANGKDRITVRHILEHRSGLSRYAPAGATVKTLLDYDAMAAGLEHAAPTEPVGEPAYHALSYGWCVGAVAQRAVARRTGAASLPSFRSLLEEHITAPLGLQGQLFAGLPEQGSHEACKYSVYDRLASCTISRPSDAAGDLFDDVATSSEGDGLALDPRLFNDPSVRRANIAAANMHFTAHALATIYASIAGCASVEQLLPVSFGESVDRDMKASHRTPWPQGFRAFHFESGDCGFGFNGLFNSTGLCVRARGGLALAVLVNTYTSTGEAATRVLDHVFSSRGYGAVKDHGLGGVSPEDDGAL